MRRVFAGMLIGGGVVSLVVVGALFVGIQGVRAQAQRDSEILQQLLDDEAAALEALQPPPVVWRLLVEVDGSVTHRGNAVSLDALEPDPDATVAEITVEEGAPHDVSNAVLDAVRRVGITDVKVTTEPEP